MTIRAGSSANRITVSDVWNVTPLSAMTGGTVAREPVAMTTSSAVNSSPAAAPVVIRRRRGPMNSAWPSNRVTVSLSRR